MAGLGDPTVVSAVDRTLAGGTHSGPPVDFDRIQIESPKRVHVDFEVPLHLGPVTINDVTEIYAEVKIVRGGQEYVSVIGNTESPGWAIGPLDAQGKARALESMRRATELCGEVLQRNGARITLEQLIDTNPLDFLYPVFDEVLAEVRMGHADFSEQAVLNACAPVITAFYDALYKSFGENFFEGWKKREFPGHQYILDKPATEVNVARTIGVGDVKDEEKIKAMLRREYSGSDDPIVLKFKASPVRDDKTGRLVAAQELETLDRLVTEVFGAVRGRVYWLDANRGFDTEDWSKTSALGAELQSAAHSSSPLNGLVLSLEQFSALPSTFVISGDGFVLKPEQLRNAFPNATVDVDEAVMRSTSNYIAEAGYGTIDKTCRSLPFMLGWMAGGNPRKIGDLTNMGVAHMVQAISAFWLDAILEMNGDIHVPGRNASFVALCGDKGLDIAGLYRVLRGKLTCEIPTGPGLGISDEVTYATREWLRTQQLV